jgi:hypothetical protein
MVKYVSVKGDSVVVNEIFVQMDTHLSTEGYVIVYYVMSVLHS